VDRRAVGVIYLHSEGSPALSPRTVARNIIWIKLDPGSTKLCLPHHLQWLPATGHACSTGSLDGLSWWGLPPSPSVLGRWSTLYTHQTHNRREAGRVRRMLEDTVGVKCGFDRSRP